MTQISNNEWRLHGMSLWFENREHGMFHFNRGEHSFHIPYVPELSYKDMNGPTDHPDFHRRDFTYTITRERFVSYDVGYKITSIHLAMPDKSVQLIETWVSRL